MTGAVTTGANSTGMTGAAPAAGGNPRGVNEAAPAAGNRPLRVSIQTLGCKLNQYESDAIATTLRSAGYSIVDSEADIRIINSCTVTAKADRKSRNALLRARRSGDALVIMTGCYVGNHRESLVAEGICDIAVENERKSRIPDIIDAYRRGEVYDPDSFDPRLFDFNTPDRSTHTRTNIKIQDGCDGFCTYCIIPHVRGRATSRPIAEVMTDAKRAVDSGAHELILTGVNMSTYSGGTDFAGLVTKLLSVPGDFRLRISSLEPDELTAEFFELFRNRKLCRHLHLCIQSGSDRTLRAMGRSYDVADFRNALRHLREVDPLFNITTDMIVGFPGETEEDIELNLSAAREFGFGHIHTFPFSARQGTPAALLPDQVPNRVKGEWARRVREISVYLKRSYRSRFVDRVEEVLVERILKTSAGLVARGYGEHYVPVEIAGSLPINEVYRVEITGLSEGDDPVLYGEPFSATG